MATIPIRDRIISQLDRLSPERQKQVLDFTASLARPHGTPSDVRLRFVGSIAPDDLDRMEEHPMKSQHTLPLAVLLMVGALTARAPTPAPNHYSHSPQQPPTHPSPPQPSARL